MSARHRLTRDNQATAYRPRMDAAVLLAELRSPSPVPIGAPAATVQPPAGVAVIDVGTPGRIPLELAAESVGVELSRDSDPNIRRI